MANEEEQSWFHCGRCGALFQSTLGERDDRVCTECGNNPSLGLEPPPAATIPQPMLEPSPEMEASDRGSRSKRHRKHNGLMLKLVIGWIVLLLLILGGTQYYLRRNAAPDRPITQISPEQETISEEDAILLRDASGLCAQAITSFFQSETPEQSLQFVLNPTNIAVKMARFTEFNTTVKIDPGSLRLTDNAVVHFPDKRGIQLLWRSQEGRVYDATFLEQNGEWRLDWEQFVRFSETPWALFLAGSGPDTGEFRLLARERLSEERKNETTISLVLYAPRFGHPNETGYQSPEFLVPRDSHDGRILEAAFELGKSGGLPFDVKLPSINPEGIIRVRAKVRRVQEGVERHFELQEIVVAHWYATDAPGLKIPDAPPAEK